MDSSNLTAFVINLDSRPDRLAEFRRRTRRCSFPIERFPAITSEHLIAQGLVAEPFPWQACTESHRSIYRIVIERNLEWALVLEDDILPIIGFDRRVRWALEAAPTEAWLVQLGHIGNAGSRTRRILRSLGGHVLHSANEQRCEQYWWGSHAYLVSKQFAEFMLEYPLNTESHDQLVRRLSLESELKHHCFVHHPNLGAQSASESDIGPGPEAIPGMRHGLRNWRRLLL